MKIHCRELVNGPSWHLHHFFSFFFLQTYIIPSHQHQDLHHPHSLSCGVITLGWLGGARNVYIALFSALRSIVIYMRRHRSLFFILSCPSFLRKMSCGMRFGLCIGYMIPSWGHLSLANVGRSWAAGAPWMAKSRRRISATRPLRFGTAWGSASSLATAISRLSLPEHGYSDLHQQLFHGAALLHPVVLGDDASRIFSSKSCPRREGEDRSLLLNPFNGDGSLACSMFWRTI